MPLATATADVVDRTLRDSRYRPPATAHDALHRFIDRVFYGDVVRPADRPFAGYFGPWPALDAPQRRLERLAADVRAHDDTDAFGELGRRLRAAWAHLNTGTCEAR